MASLVLLALLAITATIKADDDPEQIHLAFTGVSSERIVNYVTIPNYSNTSSTIPTVVQYGKDPENLDHSAKGNSYSYDLPDSKEGRSLEIHNVKLTDLEANLTYYYRVGDPDQSMSDVFSFTTYEAEMIFAVYGDMGYKNAVSLPQLISEAKNGKYQAVLHVGDLAYDFYEYHDNGNNGDDFMNSIQPIAARVPYMALPGNHEHRFNFSHYQNRFSNMESGVGKTSGSGTSLWYSFDIGLIHFVAFDTEVFDYYSDDGQIQRQLNWLEQDLAKANANRDKVPWIVSLAHKIDFMGKTNFTFLSPLLHKYGVDIHFCGHSHNYQRHFPYYEGDVDQPKNPRVYVNPKYMTVVVAGSAGSKERISKGLGPEEHLAVHVFDYGYGHLQAVNSTHLHWVWENAAVALTEQVKDYLWIVQEHHGMRLSA